jgi:hypothetical protein
MENLNESVYPYDSTPAIAESVCQPLLFWSRVNSFGSEDIQPGSVVSQAVKGSAGRFFQKHGVRMFASPDWGYTKSGESHTVYSGENPCVGRLSNGERVTVVSVWVSSIKDYSKLPYGAVKLLELRKEDGTVGFAPAHLFQKV